MISQVPSYPIVAHTANNANAEAAATQLSKAAADREQASKPEIYRNVERLAEVLDTSKTPGNETEPGKSSVEEKDNQQHIEQIERKAKRTRRRQRGVSASGDGSPRENVKLDTSPIRFDPAATVKKMKVTRSLVQAQNELPVLDFEITRAVEANLRQAEHQIELLRERIDGFQMSLNNRRERYQDLFDSGEVSTDGVHAGILDEAIRFLTATPMNDNNERAIGGLPRQEAVVRYVSFANVPEPAVVAQPGEIKFDLVA
ncbi:MAG TPA: hypothetical protein EYM98_08440 [Dehalococcoidia bacterium]|nr:hypothetical protein [Dehalococcoidia bacterium]